ncbi:hypothetical protein CASFOL_033390 [Castilleja foliolosa]|uniref:Uncharacterized protein n=1 Tax=Castilleja foliolosa TaxID=1961234 RepID=A0ABD3BZN7_9LAMI
MAPLRQEETTWEGRENGWAGSCAVRQSILMGWALHKLDALL